MHFKCKKLGVTRHYYPILLQALLIFFTFSFETETKSQSNPLLIYRVARQFPHHFDATNSLVYLE